MAQGISLIEGFTRFGDPATFAFDVKLVDDPDDLAHAPADSAGSWGQWRVWVDDLNLCDHDLALAEGSAESRDCVTWYLAPILNWLAANWAPLWHEQRLPKPREAVSAREAYLDALALSGDDPVVFEPWQSWAARHALRQASAGGWVPDLFFRRVDDDAEISWGPRVQPGAHGFISQLQPGLARPPLDAVVAAVDALLAWALKQRDFVRQAWFPVLQNAVDSRSGVMQQTSWLNWFLEGSAKPGRLRSLFDLNARQFEAPVDRGTGKLFLHPLSSPVAMFGALSPNISDAAAASLTGIVAATSAGEGADHALGALVKDFPAWRARVPWEDGYSLAEEFLDNMAETAASGATDLDAILDKLKIKVHYIDLGPAGPRGVALAGDHCTPTIVVNQTHASNRQRQGQRFTMAHELCHLLFDRNRAKSVAHASGPWVPAVVEQRANAFAAMLLMPRPALRAAFQSGPIKGSDLDSVVSAAGKLHVGVRALIHHLANLDEIDGYDRARLLDEIEARAAQPAASQYPARS